MKLNTLCLCSDLDIATCLRQHCFCFVTSKKSVRESLFNPIFNAGLKPFSLVKSVFPSPWFWYKTWVWPTPGVGLVSDHFQTVNEPFYAHGVCWLAQKHGFSTQHFFKKKHRRNSFFYCFRAVLIPNNKRNTNKTHILDTYETGNIEPKNQCLPLEHNTISRWKKYPQISALVFFPLWFCLHRMKVKKQPLFVTSNWKTSLFFSKNTPTTWGWGRLLKFLVSNAYLTSTCHIYMLLRLAMVVIRWSSHGESINGKQRRAETQLLATQST